MPEGGIYRRKVEQKLSGSHMREVWDDVNKTKSVTTARRTVEEANRHNFFNRFDQPTIPPPSLQLFPPPSLWGLCNLQYMCNCFPDV